MTPIAAVTVLYPWPMRREWAESWAPPDWIDRRVVTDPERGGLAVVLISAGLGREVVQVPPDVCCAACVHRSLSEAAERLRPSPRLDAALSVAWAAFDMMLPLPRPAVKPVRARPDDCDTSELL